MKAKKILKMVLKIYGVFLSVSALALWASQNSLAVARNFDPAQGGVDEAVKKTDFRFVWFNIIDNFKEVARLVIPKV